MNTAQPQPPRSPPSSALLPAVARGIALFLGGFSLLNVLGELRTPGFDANEWWIDLRALPRGLAMLALALGGGVLIIWALHAARHPLWIRIVQVVTLVLLAVVTANVLMFYGLLERGKIRSAVWIPFSACIALALLTVLIATFRATPAITKRSAALAAGVFLACLVLFPLAQIVCYGHTDYRRRADAIVVLGARAYADGSLSTALSDRVATAVELYNAGYASLLIFSGGPGDAAIDEPEAMRRFALSHGVPESAIICDSAGLNTERTAENTAQILRQRGLASALAVSHSWHLPRVKLAFQREQLQIFTVPARGPRPLAGRRYLAAREVAGLWAYYLRPLWR